MKPILLISGLLLVQLAVYSQKKNFYTDFDLLTLKGINQVAAAETDSLSAFLQYSVMSSGKLKKLAIVTHKSNGRKKYRKADIIQHPYGTLIRFATLKTPGYEKVIIFADWDYYHDAILIRNDTILYKHESDNYIKLVAIPPAKNDTLTIRKISKQYGHGSNRPYETWEDFSDYAQWFGKINGARTETYRLVKTGDHYEVTEVKTNSGSISEYDYKSAQEDYRKIGLSLFWILVRHNIYF
jgi:hypothetical protein